MKKRLIIINSPVTAFFVSMKLQELKIKKRKNRKYNII
jgi:hypothetical protein